MDLPNPAINPPLLTNHSSTARRSLHSRSPSRSPVRLQHFDPLLRDLSPTSTLRAFSTSSSRPGDNYSAATHPPQHLIQSVQDATHTQRALGIKAAQTCLDVRAWTRELELWEWPGRFDGPAGKTNGQKSHMRDSQQESPTDARAGEDAKDGNARMPTWGSLPMDTVQSHAQRLDEIGQQLDEVDVEELKDFVLSAHSRAGSAPADVDDSIGAIGAATDLKRLDDFTALITATILQTLPYLSRLQRLLNSWTVRVAVLAAAPAYLKGLEQARRDLLLGWNALGKPSTESHRGGAVFGREEMRSFQTLISGQVARLGRRLDSFLDQLEGRTETVPDSWIDEFEALESQYSDWVVRAEHKIVESEWHATLNHQNDLSDSGSSRTGTSQRPERSIYSDREDPSKDADAMVQPSSKQSPADKRREEIKAAAAFAVASIGIDPVDSIVADGPGENGMEPQSEASSAVPFTSRSDSDYQHLNPGLPTSTRGSFQEDWQMPDTLSASQSGDPYSGLGIQDTERSDSSPIPPPTLEDDNAAPPPTVKSRAAFFNQKLEKAGTLNKSKSPPVVRPFEHASNAFTRLFKKNNLSPEQPTRASSTSSKRSVSSSKDGKDTSSVRAEPLGVEIQQMGKTSPRRGRFSEEFGSADQPRAEPASPVLHRSTGSNSGQIVPSTVESTAIPVQSSPSRPTSWSTAVPQTYIPTGMLHSPFHSPAREEFALPDDDPSAPEFPPNWPLASEPAVQTSVEAFRFPHSGQMQDETRASEAVIGSDAFDRAFVDNLSTNDDGARVAGRRSLDELPARSSSFSGFSSSPSPSRPGQPTHRRQFSRPISTVEEEDASGDETPPSVQDTATNGNDIPAVPVKRLRGRSRSTSVIAPMVRHVRSPSAPASGVGVVQMVHRDSIIRRAKPKSIESFSLSDVKKVDVPGPARRHSASSAMYRIAPGTHSADEGSLPSSSGTHTPQNELATSPSPLIYQGQLFPSPPSRPPSLPSSVISQDDSPSLPRTLITSEIDKDQQSSPSPSNGIVDPQSPSLNGMMTKRRSKIPVTRPGDLQSSPLQSTAPASASANQGGDNFDRHVSAVLDRVHAPIRFRTRPGAETPAGFRPNEPTKSYNGLKPKNSKIVPRGGPSNITLAPADPTPRKQRPGAEDVKVYHLQTGADDPIKLFVRLVGEDERVMVRVGGGWADLADYLRQYAEHHGSRTVSEGVFEVSSVNPSNPSSSSSSLGPNAVMNKALGSAASKRTVSMPVESSARARTPRPTTPLAFGNAGAPAQSAAYSSRSNDADREWLNQPQPLFGMGDEDLSDMETGSSHRPQQDFSSQGSPTPAGTVTTTTWTPRRGLGTSTTTGTSTNMATTVTRGGGGTPTKLPVSSNGAAYPSAQPDSSASSTPVSFSASRPSFSTSTTTTTSGPFTTTTSSSSNVNNTNSLAGPGSAKKAADLPDQKARWVEDMLGRAKQDGGAVNGNTNGGGRFGFAELGKAGGTRRVVFKK